VHLDQALARVNGDLGDARRKGLVLLHDSNTERVPSRLRFQSDICATVRNSSWTRGSRSARRCGIRSGPCQLLGNLIEEALDREAVRERADAAHRAEPRTQG